MDINTPVVWTAIRERKRRIHPSHCCCLSIRHPSVCDSAVAIHVVHTL